MFGSKTPFGGGGFGSTSSAFGSQQSTPFGATSGGLFGSTTPAAGTFGTPSFGSTTPAAGGGLFGATSSQGSSLFGTKTTQSSGFGFGNTGTSTSGGLFGGGATTNSLFQTPKTNSVFGQPQQKSAFGGFGTSSSGNAFGTTSAFGSTTAGTGTSLFGGASAFGQQNQSGTTIKFQPVSSTEQTQKSGIAMTVKTHNQCITVMDAYKTKSIEELRFEDYAANRKGSSGATSGFGASTGTTGGGLFGSTSSSGTSLFGNNASTKPTGFGAFGNTATSGGLFGQTGTSLFGAKTTQSLFGSTTTTTPSSGFSGFGATQPSGGLFGTTPASSGFGFGTTTTSQPSLFGGTSGFGATTSSSGGLFGGTSTFGQTSTQSGGLFGSTAAKPAFGGFGTSTAGTGFGTGTGNAFSFGNNNTSSSGGMFGNNANKSTFSFGGTGSTGFGNNPTTGFGGFGATSSSGGLFGGGAATSGSLFSKPLGFGTTNTTGGTSLFGGATQGGGLFGGSTGITGGLGVDQGTLAALKQQQMIQQQLKAIANTPFGDSPLFRNLPNSSKAKTSQSLNIVPPRDTLSTSQYKVLSRPAARIKPRPVSSPSLGKSRLFDGLEEDGDFSPHPISRKSSVKKLIIKDKGHHESDSPYDSQLKFRSFVDDDLVVPSPSVVKTRNDSSTESPRKPKLSSGPVFESTISELNSKDVTVTPIIKKTKDYILTPLSESLNDTVGADIQPPEDESFELPKCKIILRRPEYYTRPTIQELDEIVNGNTCMTRDFIVGREGYGEITFLGITNVYGLNLDDIVFFRRREAEVYPDDYPNKPEVGEELNKPSEITIFKVWPNDKSTHTPVKTPERLKVSGFIERIEEKTLGMGAVFIDYRPREGAWVFKVNHYTRYGIQEQFISDEVENNLKKKTQMKEQSFVDDIDFQRDAIKARLKKHMFQKYDEEMDDEEDEHLEENETEEETEEMADEDENDTEENENFEEQQTGEVYEENFEEEIFPMSHQLGHVARVQPFNIQGMKTSVLYEEEEEYAPSPQTAKENQQLFANKSIFSSTYVDPMRKQASSFLKLDTPKANETEQNKLNASLFQTMLNDDKLFDRTPKVAKTSHLFKSGLLLSTNKDTAEVSVVEQEIVKENVFVKCKTFDMVPYNKSLVYGKLRLLADAGLLHGREYNTRWTSNWAFVHSAKPVGCASSLNQTNKPLNPHIFSSTAHQPLPTFGLCDLNVNVEQVEVKSNEGMKQFIEECLDIALKYTQFEDNETSMLNSASIQAGIDALESYVEVADAFTQVASDEDVETFKTHSDAWQLAAALWGKQDFDNDGNLYEIHSGRREALSQWLSNSTADQIEKEVDSQKLQDDGHLAVIFSLLSGHQITKACQIARENKEFRLGFLLAQATGDSHMKHYLRSQLAQWDENNVDNFMNSDRLKLYVLLSGMMVWKSNKNLLNLCENLDWKRCLAMHLWYYCSSATTVLDAFTEYQNSFKGSDSYEPYSAYPSPMYADGSGSKVKDLCYHLLALYCNRPHSLEKMLTPQTHTDNIIDYHLSWHLQRVLEDLGYTHMTDERHSFLQYSYASQLETLGLWQWAIFVLMHLRDDERREVHVRESLERHCRVNEDDSIDLTDEESLLVERFNVPVEWIHEAKALHAKYTKEHFKEAMLLIRACQWNRAHQVILEHLAADSIIEDDHETLYGLLQDISLPERVCTVKNWRTGGQVFLDYISLHQKLEDIKSGSYEISSYHLEDMESEVASLINRISLLKVNTSRERLCQSEMARNCSNMLKIVFSEMKTRDNEQDMEEENPKWSTSKVAPYVVKLPLPPDYYLKELRELLANYANELEQEETYDDDS